MNKPDESCYLCGMEDTHRCGDDFMCDRCCNNIMGLPYELKGIFEWLDKIVCPHVIELKKKEQHNEPFHYQM